ncbi:uncharacterized protein RHIMIDRAFT_305307 [Rhizopus microsporus ATCC 52813]|uniref:Uncharacterized protein n=1 Tax=Rhizopus microsporus ATCC 52813 TaxID=1340429 RepID=A0A2G4SFP3_RHIZD|nr:uncharacterized protein RHIMIDRAFT_305307 [Rhizopus microsporus ATCC 52813]PHZ07206.1 hypothetical protein RHIMIDRAFT_305307 [Rhizopus microsporus ATCC 52813]
MTLRTQSRLSASLSTGGRPPLLTLRPGKRSFLSLSMKVRLTPARLVIFLEDKLVDRSDRMSSSADLEIARILH